MPSKNNKNESEPPAPAPIPSTGEGAESALEVLRRKRAEIPPADGSLPLHPPEKT